MENILQKYCQDNHVDGLSLAIIDQGKITYDYHYQSNEHMRYTIGSVSKLFIAIGIMQLVDENKVQLEDNVNQYIPGFYPDITIRMLLNHSSGIDCVHFTGKYTNEPYEAYIDCMIERYQHVPVKSRAGKYGVYTNDGFVLAQRIIEKVSGMNFHDYLKEYICKPLGMEDTTCPNERMAEGTYKRVISEFGKEYPQEFVNGIGSGGIYSTSHDLAKLLHSFAEKTLLSNESINEIMKNQFVSHIHIDQNASCYGLGLDHVELPYFKAMGYKAIMKGGATYGYLSNIIYLPELDIGLAVVSGSLEGRVGDLAKQILGKYLNKEVGKVLLEPFEGDIDLGIYGNGNHVYNLYMKDHKLVVEIYQDGKFVPYCIMEYRKKYFFAAKAFGFRDVKLSFYKQNGYSYIILDYMTEVYTRCIFAQKLEDQDCMINLEIGYYVRSNENFLQRNMNTQDQLCIYIDPNLYLPYPLKAITDDIAIPYVELPGSYAREMTSLYVKDSTHFTLGQYDYEKLEGKKLESHIIEDERIHYYTYTGEKLEFSNQVRVFGLDKKGKYVYDSFLSTSSIEGDYIGILGKIGEEIKVD